MKLKPKKTLKSWFAWYPVTLEESGYRVWLEWVQCKRVTNGYLYTWWYYQ